MLDPDVYRKERLYTEELDQAFYPKMDGFRALFQVRWWKTRKERAKPDRHPTLSLPIVVSEVAPVYLLDLLGCCATTLNCQHFIASANPKDGLSVGWQTIYLDCFR